MHKTHEDTAWKYILMDLCPSLSVVSQVLLGKQDVFHANDMGASRFTLLFGFHPRMHCTSQFVSSLFQVSFIQHLLMYLTNVKQYYLGDYNIVCYTNLN